MIRRSRVSSGSPARAVKIDFVAVRFKDDYRILCQTESDAEYVLKTISMGFSENNLLINENKTSILELPDGLYRNYDREYFPHSLRECKSVSFKVFEHTLLIALNIHRKNVGTSILEKFFSELFTKNNELKIQFEKNSSRRERQIEHMISLLFLVKRESEKVLCHILSITEQLFINYLVSYPELKGYLKSIIENEIIRASTKESVFEIIWLVFFSRYIGLGITNFNALVNNVAVTKNEFYKSIITGQQKIFNDSGIELFRKPSKCKDATLAKHLAIFDR